MPSIFSAMKDRTGTESERRAARIILGLVLMALAAHLIFFAFGVGQSAIEAYYSGSASGVHIYAALLDLLPGDNVWAGRLFSVFCAIAGAFWLSRLCAAWSRDPVAGAVMPVGLVLFPQTAFVFALSTPLAAQMLMTIAGLAAAEKMKTSDITAPALCFGGICGLLPYLDSSGLGVSAGLAVLAFGSRLHPKLVAVSAAAALSTFILVGLWSVAPGPAAPTPDLFATQAASLTDGLWRAFSMLWVALGFSVTALGLSAKLRRKIGRDAVRRSILAGAGFAVSLVWLIVGAGHAASTLPVAFNGIIVLGVIASLPMVMWIRFVMPSITSVWIWILLPVVMYSCFWVILGPINLAGFPYDQLVREP